MTQAIKKLVLVGCSILAVPVSQAAATSATLTPERVVGQPSLSGKLADDVRISPDGRYVAYVESAANDPKASVLWLRDVTGGAPRALVDSRALGEAPVNESIEAMKARERRYQATTDAIDYRWDTQGRMVVISFAGDLYLLPLAGGKPQRITATPEDEIDPQFSADDRYLSYARGKNLFVRDLLTGREERVAADASETVSYGRAEFIAQEEMRRFTGQWWSPEGDILAYARVDESRVKVIPRVLVGARDTQVREERYPLTGTPNASVTILIRKAGEAPPVTADLGTDGDFYVADAAWSRDGRTFYVERQSRDQKTLDLVAVDARTGRSRTILTEKSSTWVDLARDFRPLVDGNFLWGSSRSGWRHLYLYNKDGQLIRPVTSGNWRITNYSVAAPETLSSLVGVDEVKGLVYFAASMDTPLEAQLYRTSYLSPSTPQRITGNAGWWSPYMPANAANIFVATFSNVTTPPQTAIYDADGKRLAWLSENPLDANHPLYPFLKGRPTYQFGTLAAADGTPLHYVVVKPAGFDPHRRYPLLIRTYGGPNVQTVRNEWRSLVDQLLTENGYVLFQIDGRGGVNRAERFEHALSGSICSVNMDDQLAGARFAEHLPFVDPTRVGMLGWSFGAYTTVRLLTEPGSGIRAGAAGGTPTDFALYDTHYTERFLGTPDANPKGYRDCGLLPRLKSLHGALLLMHGLADDNVVVPNFTAAVSELEAQGKTFETAVYPGMGHVPRGPHLWKTQLDFFKRRLAPLPRSTGKPEAR